MEFKEGVGSKENVSGLAGKMMANPGVARERFKRYLENPEGKKGDDRLIEGMILNQALMRVVLAGLEDNHKLPDSFLVTEELRGLIKEISNQEQKNDLFFRIIGARTQAGLVNFLRNNGFEVTLPETRADIKEIEIKNKADFSAIGEEKAFFIDVSSIGREGGLKVKRFSHPNSRRIYPLIRTYPYGYFYVAIPREEGIIDIQTGKLREDVGKKIVDRLLGERDLEKWSN